VVRLGVAREEDLLVEDQHVVVLEEVLPVELLQLEVGRIAEVVVV